MKNKKSFFDKIDVEDIISSISSLDQPVSDFFKVISVIPSERDKDFMELVLIKINKGPGSVPGCKYAMTLPRYPNEEGWYISPSDKNFRFMFYISSAEEFVQSYILKVQKLQKDYLEELTLSLKSIFS